MGGIKGMLFVLAIVGSAVALYFRSSMSLDAPDAPPAPETMQTVKALEPKAPEPKAAAVPQVVETTKGPAPNAASAADPAKAAKKRHDRVVAGKILERCKAGKEKRAVVCAHARQVFRVK